MVDRRDALRPTLAPISELNALEQSLAKALADKLIEVVEAKVPALAAQFPNRTPAEKRQDVLELVEAGLVKFTYDPADEVFGFTVYNGSKYIPI